MEEPNPFPVGHRLGQGSLQGHSVACTTLQERVSAWLCLLANPLAVAGNSFCRSTTNHRVFSL